MKYIPKTACFFNELIALFKGLEIIKEMNLKNLDSEFISKGKRLAFNECRNCWENKINRKNCLFKHEIREIIKK